MKKTKTGKGTIIKKKHSSQRNLSSFMDRKALHFVYELICFSLIVYSQQWTENGTHKMSAVNDSNVFRTNGQKKESKSERKMKRKLKKRNKIKMR